MSLPNQWSRGRTRLKVTHCSRLLNEARTRGRDRSFTPLLHFLNHSKTSGLEKNWAVFFSQATILHWLNIQPYNFTCWFVYVWNLVSLCNSSLAMFVILPIQLCLPICNNQDIIKSRMLRTVYRLLLCFDMLDGSQATVIMFTETVVTLYPVSSDLWLFHCSLTT
jgi:hypothetical protein